MEQGENPATFADSLVQRQSSCRPTSHRKPRQKHARSRSSDLEHSTKEDQRHLRAETKELSSPTSAAHLYPQEKRPKTSFRHSRYEMQSDASSLLAGSGPSSGNHSGPQLVWFSTSKIDG